MTEINLLFEFTDDNELDEAAQVIQDRLTSIEAVEEAEARPERMKVTGLEIAAAIGVTVLVVRGSRELVEEVRKLVTEVKKLMIEFQDLKEVYVDIGTQRVSLSEFSEEQYLQLPQEEA